MVCVTKTAGCQPHGVMQRNGAQNGTTGSEEVSSCQLTSEGGRECME